MCLPQPHQEFTGVKCWVTGWGQDAWRGEGELQAVLQEVDVPVVTDQYCQDALRREGLGSRCVPSDNFNNSLLLYSYENNLIQDY